MSYLSPRLRSVYFLGDGLLFDEIITTILASQAEIRVTKRVYVNADVFLTDVSWYQPDVILLNETDRFNYKHVRRLLPELSLIPNLRIIAVSLKSNNVKIFDQTADQTNRWLRMPYTIKRLTDWKELLDLVAGKQLLGMRR